MSTRNRLLRPPPRPRSRPYSTVNPDAYRRETPTLDPSDVDTLPDLDVLDLPESVER